MTIGMQKVIKDTEQTIQNLQDKDLKNALKNLIALAGKLEEMKANKEKGLNVFYEVGMATQEIRHSTFLSRLLNPECPHGLGNEFLKKFLLEVYNHKSNAAIINRTLNGHKIDKIWLSKRISIKCEEHLTIEEGGRTDILIDTGSVVVVIENKVFTSTHDNQLQRYEKQYKDRDKVLIFLTPQGEEPYENKVPRPNWCVFDYGSILKVIDGLNVTNAKMKIILEDYKEMVNTEILKKNSAVRTLSKAIWEDYADAIGLLMEYTDNLKEVLLFCVEKLTHMGLVIFSINDSSINFYSKRLKDYYDKTGSQITSDKCYRIGTESGNIVKYFILSKIAPKQKGETSRSGEFLSWKERGQVFDDAMKKEVENRLEEFLRRIENYENKFITS